MGVVDRGRRTKWSSAGEPVRCQATGQRGVQETYVTIVIVAHLKLRPVAPVVRRFQGMQPAWRGSNKEGSPAISSANRLRQQ